MALFTTAAITTGFLGLASATGWLGWKYVENLIKSNKEKNEKLEKENAERKEAALAFLGKDSDQHVGGDDAPDVEIPLSPVEVMGNIAGGLLLPHTQVGDIDTSAIVVSSFADIVKEIEKINKNIEAIHGAMLASAIIESNYRQEVIADLEQAIADKDKARSQRRAGRRRGKVEDRKKFKVPGAVFGNKLKRTLGQMAAITTAFAITEFIATVRDKGIGWLTGDKKKTDDAEAGGIFTGPDSGYPVTLHGTELVIPLNNNVTDGISGNEVTSRGNRVSNIFKNGSSSFALSNKSNIFSSSPASSSSSFNSRISSIINSNSSTTIPVGDDQGSFTVIDMRTAQKLVNSKEGGSSISDGNEVITLSPERRMSPYEPFVTRHV